METTLARNWWALLLRGFVALAFGFLAWFLPGMTLAILIVLFGAYAAIDGIFAIVSAVRAARGHERWWPVALQGVLGLAAAAVAFLRPAAAALGLLIVVAAWALSTGVMELVAAVRLRKQIKGEWLLALSGVLSVVLGVLLLLNPAVGVLAMTWMLAAYAIVYGALLVGLSIRLKRTRPVERRPIDIAPQPV